jgi:hypothetical protein
MHDEPMLSKTDNRVMANNRDPRRFLNADDVLHASQYEGFLLALAGLGI